MRSLLLPLFAINDAHSMLNPAGRQADQISRLWWIFFFVLIVVFLLVTSVLFIALYRRRGIALEAVEPDDVELPSATKERKAARVVISAVLVTVIILFILLIADFFVGRSIYALGAAPGNPLVIKITGHQWWWEVEYENENEPSKVFQTANEIHVPVGRPVKLDLESNDVIHSFWVPNMHGKKDLVPGHPAETWLRADRAGVFRGQCAEFCGEQHALMRLTFVADTPEAFESWKAIQLSEAPQPKTDSERRGQQIFVSTQCMMCHAISGTNARATLGPNLTHVASRLTLAAGAVPNNRGYLAGWIANPQNIKPGTRMPPNLLSSGDLNALLDYLELLK